LLVFVIKHEHIEYLLNLPPVLGLLRLVSKDGTWRENISKIAKIAKQ